MIKYCECGCGTDMFNSANRFVYGHNFKMVTRRKYYINHDIFNILTTETCYWIGFITADGSLYHENNVKYLTLELKIDDKSHLEKFKNFLQCSYPIKEVKNGKSTKIKITSTQIYDTLISYGICERKSYIDFNINNEILLNSPDFWRGMIDGDGSVIDSSRRILFSAKHENILIKYCNFIENNLMFRPNIHYVLRDDFYSTTIIGKNAVALSKLIYEKANVYLDRKYKNAISIIDKDN